MLKIVHAALKTKAKAWSRPSLEDYVTGLQRKKSEEKERAVDSSEQNASRSLRPINHVLERDQCLMKMQSVGDAITMRH